MKNKKRFSWAELCLGKSLRKNYLTILFLILLSTGFNSCKKELLVLNATPTDGKSKIKTMDQAKKLGRD